MFSIPVTYPDIPCFLFYLARPATTEVLLDEYNHLYDYIKTIPFKDLVVIENKLASIQLRVESAKEKYLPIDNDGFSITFDTDDPDPAVTTHSNMQLREQQLKARKVLANKWITEVDRLLDELKSI